MADLKHTLVWIHDAEGKVIKEAAESAWGYRAVVQDPDGRTVELYEEPVK